MVMKNTVFKVFVDWRGPEAGQGSPKSFTKLADAMAAADELVATGYEKDGRCEVRVLKITVEKIR